MTILQTIWDKVFGRSDLGVDGGLGVPAMDGVFKPNALLEGAELIVSVPNIDSLASIGNRLFCSAGNELIEITFPKSGTKSKAKLKSVKRFEGSITFLTASADGVLALGIAGQGIKVGKLDQLKAIDLPVAQNSCVTAGAFGRAGQLLVTVGSSQHAEFDWKRDLMSGAATGQVLSIDITTGSTSVIAQNLAYPNGIISLSGDRFVVSESWRHRIIAISPDGTTQVVLDDLPAYPSRLAHSTEAGFWLALFAPRRQLFEFILREEDFRRSMQTEMDPGEWVGPELSSSIAPDQPMTKGLVRQMGILKPWAPSQSYGLIAKCSAKGDVLQSYHSRADGFFHGITDVLQFGQQVYAASKGYGALLKLPVSEIREAS